MINLPLNISISAGVATHQLRHSPFARLANTYFSFRKFSLYSRLLSIGLMISLSSCVNVPENHSMAAFARDIDAKIDEGLTALEVVQGSSVAVYSPGGVYTKGYGVADIETGESVSHDTAFYIASSTKPLTAITFSLLHHRGEINLDSTLAAFAPDAVFPAQIKPNEVTLRDLLSNSSGLVNRPIQYRLAFTGQHTPETLWRLLTYTKANEKAALGTFQYTNYNFNILTILTDRVLENPNAEDNYQKTLKEAVRKRNQYEERAAASRAKRAQRTSKLSLPLEAYAGEYVNEFGESFKVSVMGEVLHVSMGKLAAVSEPSTKSEVIRIGLLPGFGQTLEFGLTSENTVDRLMFVDEIYKIVAATPFTQTFDVRPSPSERLYDK